MQTEIVSILKNKVDFQSFCIKYFNTFKSKSNGQHYSNIDGEKLNYSTAQCFYEDYVYSNYNLNQYIKETSSPVKS